jgi:hypothetical protein
MQLYAITLQQVTTQHLVLLLYQVNTTGAFNTAIGRQALELNTTAALATQPLDTML